MLAKTEPPASAITWETTAGSQLKLAEPTPSRIPAIGSTDTGSISDLPTFCRLANAFLNIIESAPEYLCFFLRFHALARGEYRAVDRTSKRPLFITQSKIIPSEFV